MINDKLRFVIWGTGVWGTKAKNILSDYEIKGYIDNDKKKIGTIINGLSVFSFKEYLDNYIEYCIVIAVFEYKAMLEIENQIKEKGVKLFFRLNGMPQEFLYPTRSPVTMNDLIEEIVSNNSFGKYIIKGINLFSFLLYDFLLDSNMYVSFSDEFSNDFIMELVTIYPRYKFKNNGKDENNSIILITDRIIALNKKNDNIKENEYLFYSFIGLKRYRCNKLCKFKDMYKGKRCFIVATGPSLKISDLDLLYKNHEYCFGVNRIYLSYEHTKWRPNFLVVSDNNCLLTYDKELIRSEADYKFFSAIAEEFWVNNSLLIKDHSEIYKFNARMEFFEIEGPEFSSDIVQGTFEGCTVVYQCLQIAAYMGFSKIYLIGTDCNYSLNDKSDNNHFVKGYLKDYKHKAVYNIERMMFAYKNAYKYAIENNIEIYNASRGGKLEEFPRIDFDLLFDN